MEAFADAEMHSFPLCVPRRRVPSRGILHPACFVVDRRARVSIRRLLHHELRNRGESVVDQPGQVRFHAGFRQTKELHRYYER